MTNKPRRNRLASEERELLERQRDFKEIWIERPRANPLTYRPKIFGNRSRRNKELRI
jgi:hypothetical protein